MTIAMRIYTKPEAERLTKDIRSTANTIRHNIPRLWEMLEDAKHGNVVQILGYQSWTAYLSDVLGQEPMRLPREERQELVAMLAGEGMSVRAIAPMVGATKSQVARDIAAVPNGTPDFNPTPTLPPPEDDWAEPIVTNYNTGEVIEAPVTTEITETRKEKVTVGLDGKQYAQKPREPKPVITGDAANLQNAETASREIGTAIEVLSRFNNQAHRIRILTDWWPLGKGAVPPVNRDLFTPAQLRQIAESIQHLATEMENQNVV